MQLPALDPAALDVARAEHQVGIARGGDQPRHVGRVVREVGVHLEDQLGPAGQRLPEARDVGAPEALLAAAVQHLDGLVLGGEPVRDRTGAVGRVVVHHEHAVLARRLGQLGEHGRDDRLEVLGLVVRR